MTVYLASGNAHKAREFQALADGLAPVRRLPVEIISAAAMGGMPQVVEDAGSFTGNARKKARALLSFPALSRCGRAGSLKASMTVLTPSLIRRR